MDIMEGLDTPGEEEEVRGPMVVTGERTGVTVIKVMVLIVKVVLVGRVLDWSSPPSIYSSSVSLLGSEGR